MGVDAVNPLIAFGALWVAAGAGLVIASIAIRRAARDEFSPERKALEEMGRFPR